MLKPKSRQGVQVWKGKMVKINIMLARIRLKTQALKLLVYDLFRSSSKRHLRWNQVARLNTLLAPITFSNIFNGFFLMKPKFEEIFRKFEGLARLTETLSLTINSLWIRSLWMIIIITMVCGSLQFFKSLHHRAYLSSCYLDTVIPYSHKLESISDW